MTEIHKKTVVPYSAEEMYALVNNIEAYPEFLPWCTKAEVLTPGEFKLTARVVLETGKIRQTFMTENTMQPGRRIEMNLIKGPFKYLKGHWQFSPEDDNQSTVSLDMEFEFKNKLLKLTLSNAFNKIMGTMVVSFINRAEAIYGKQ